MPVMDEELQDFLEHHGIRGMHWGYRKSKARRGDFHSRSGKQKAALVGGGVAGYLVGAKFAASLMNRVGRKVLKPENLVDMTPKDIGKLAAFGGVNSAVALTSTVVGTIYGARLARNFMDRHRNDRVSTIRKPKS